MQKKYTEYLQSRTSKACIFCAIPSDQPESIVEEGKSTLVITNRFGYQIWEGCTVIDQLMVIPKEHRDSLQEFNREEQAEWFGLCAKYEAKGYSLYTRSPENITKSIPHHHTHFIKLDNKRRSFVVYLRKPHLLITR